MFSTLKISISVELTKQNDDFQRFGTFRQINFQTNINTVGNTELLPILITEGNGFHLLEDILFLHIRMSIIVVHKGKKMCCIPCPSDIVYCEGSVR